jgi:hypothetical protein
LRKFKWEGVRPGGGGSVYWVKGTVGAAVCRLAHLISSTSIDVQSEQESSSPCCYSIIRGRTLPHPQQGGETCTSASMSAQLGRRNVPSRNTQSLPSIPYNDLFNRMITPSRLHLEKDDLSPANIDFANPLDSW